MQLPRRTHAREVTGINCYQLALRTKPVRFPISTQTHTFKGLDLGNGLGSIPLLFRSWAYLCLPPSKTFVKVEEKNTPEKASQTTRTMLRLFLPFCLFLLCLCLCICLSASLCISVSLCLSVFICLSASLSLSHYLSLPLSH